MESELVSGFMTEHAAVVFVFFFLAEYGSIVLMCILTSLLFLGGYLPIYSIFYFAAGVVDFLLHVNSALVIQTGPAHIFIEYLLTNPNFEGVLYGLTIGLKSSIMIFVFIWARASFPRIRFDQLMSFCWTVLLPILFAVIIFIPCVLYSFDIDPVTGFSLFAVPFITLNTNAKDVNMSVNLPAGGEATVEGNIVSVPVKKHYTNLTENSSISSIKLDLQSVSGVYAFVHNKSRKTLYR